MIRPALILFLFLLTSGSLSLYGGDNNVSEIKNSSAPSSVFERLSDKEILDITINTDIVNLLENKNSSEYQYADMSFLNEDGETEQWKIQIRARGKYRKQKCDFPPVKIKFDHATLGPENLKAYKSLKLVTHCSEEAEAEELVTKEYLAYKIYNEITDTSLRVQLLKIIWIDSKDSINIGKKWGFFIENEDEMARRIGGEIYDEFGVVQSELYQQTAANLSLFQYMIGNIDWDVTQNKNVNIIKSNQDKDLLVVPYDFDFSALVNAPYVVVDRKYKLTSLKDRIYLGKSEKTDLSKAIKLFKSKKKQILNHITSFSHSSRSRRNEMKKYIRSFFDELDNDLKYPEYYLAIDEKNGEK